MTEQTRVPTHNLEAELMRAVAATVRHLTRPDGGLCRYCGHSLDTLVDWECPVCDLRDAYVAVVEDRQEIPASESNEGDPS